MTRRNRRHNPAAWLVLVLVLLILPAVVRVLAVVVLVAIAAGITRWSWSRRRPPARPVATQTNPGLLAELDQANAEIRDLRGQLDDAQASATAAWDQASNRPPRRPIGDTQPLDVLDAEQLATTPMSGARSLFGGQP
jgi:hypothetical protein